MFPAQFCGLDEVGALSVSECEPRELSRIEVISEQSLDVDELDGSLRESIDKTEPSC